MSNDQTLWSHEPPKLGEDRPSELLFSFRRTSDNTPLACELRFNGESYGCEAMFKREGELFISRGGFATRTEAIQWAIAEHAAQVKDWS
jgi:hypothetical protein